MSESTSPYRTVWIITAKSGVAPHIPGPAEFAELVPERHPVITYLTPGTVLEDVYHTYFLPGDPQPKIALPDRAIVFYDDSAESAGSADIIASRLHSQSPSCITTLRPLPPDHHLFPLPGDWPGKDWRRTNGH